MRDRTRAGFTLIEAAVTVTVSLVLFGLVFQATQGLIQLSSTSLAAGKLEEASGRISTTIASELRWANPETLQLTVENGSTRVDCEIAEGYDGTNTLWSTTVTFHYVPSPVDENENGVLDEGSVVREQDGITRVLGRHVSQGGLSVTSEDGTLVVSVTVFAEDRQGRDLEATTTASAQVLNRSTW
jgi:Tfp pilus assembly protein PilE